jgi:saccharopine dehydrogenase (NAD+, L-lysine-forming)
VDAVDAGKRVTVLGGCGAVGSVAVKTLVQSDDFSHVVIADMNIEKADQMAAALGGDKVTATACNAHDVQSVRDAIRGSNVVLNCVGPFYLTVKPILAAVIESRINYVDICDDVDVTLDILQNMDPQAREAGITALIGMGSSPGLTNIVARYAADVLLDGVDSVDIFHTHGGEPTEGAGVIAHRFHCMSIPIPMYLGGKLQYVDFFSADGIALRQKFDFPYIGESTIYPYPHPEQITLPRHIKLQRVTNKGSVLPEAYYNLTRDLCLLGLASTAPVDVKGRMVVPRDFAIAYIIRERERILKETGFGEQRGCVSVIVKGIKDGEKVEYHFHMASTHQALGEGTGIPAAMGAILMQRGQVQGKGILPPEACINPADFLPFAVQMFASDAASKGKKAEGFIIDRVDEQGHSTRMSL